jgi:CheY-like chemotaxis protein
MTRPVLIVEDKPDIAEGLRYNLEREGLPALVAETGEKGLAAALDKENPPALILLDLMLPGMSGAELCRRLRREPQTRRTPIIMPTARGPEVEDDVPAGAGGVVGPVVVAHDDAAVFRVAARGDERAAIAGLCVEAARPCRLSSQGT